MTFASIHDALKAEKALRLIEERQGQKAGELVPLPPAIRSDCGFGLLLDAAEGGEACRAKALRESGVEVEDVYRVIEREAENGSHKEKSYERID
jgi:hypothetical protein